MSELSVLMRPEARVPLAPPLLRHWVGRLKAITNFPYCHCLYCSFRRHYNLRNSYCKLFNLNHQCFQLLMRDQAHSRYITFIIQFKPSVLSAFDEGTASQYIHYFCNTCCFAFLFFESWNCWIFTIISLFKYIQFDLNNWWKTYIVIWRNLWATTLWRINRMASHNYFKWQKNKCNNIKLVKNWLKYKLDPGLWKTLETSSAWNWGMVGDVTPSHTLNIFPSVLDDLQKWPLRGVGGCCPQSSP